MHFQILTGDGAAVANQKTYFPAFGASDVIAVRVHNVLHILHIWRTCRLSAA
jgi:hypothetical protein